MKIKTELHRKDTPIMDIKAIEKLTTTAEVADQLQEAFIVTTTVYKHNNNNKNILTQLRIVIKFRTEKSNSFGILMPYGNSYMKR